MSIVRIRRQRGGSVLIGRHIRITVGEISADGEWVDLHCEQPASLAVSRDEDGIGPHLKKQHAFDLKAGRVED